MRRPSIGAAVSIDDVKARLIAQVPELRAWAKDEVLPTEQVEALLSRFDAVSVTSVRRSGGESGRDELHLRKVQLAERHGSRCDA